jgi:hypothetical protein
MYFPRNWEFGSALSKLRKFGEGLNTPNPPPPSVLHCTDVHFLDYYITLKMTKSFIGLHVKYPVFFSDFNEIQFSQHILEECSFIKFHKNPSIRSRNVSC